MRCVILVVGALATTGTLHAQRVTPADWSALTARIDGAAISGSAVALQEVRWDLLRTFAPPASTDHRPLVLYAIAYTAWRMAFLSRVPARDRDEMLDDAVLRLQALVRADATDIEAQALLGGVYAAQAGRSRIKAILLGSRASGTLDHAATLDPENPRVRLLQGINAFHTPAVFGGGLERAERLLRRSVVLFAADRANREWPNWGRVDAHAWLGQVLLKAGDRTGAHDEYDKALALAPESGWIRNVLVPALGDSAKR